MRCQCGALVEGCALFGYCTGPRASARDRDLAEADRAYLRALFPDCRTVEQTMADAARAQRELAAHEAAASEARVAECARDDARLTRWCASCEADVFPVYPRERTCVRCGEAFESEIEQLAAEE